MKPHDCEISAYGSRSCVSFARRGTAVAAMPSLDRSAIDNDAAGVVRKLTRAGYKAYLVGGCVRDLLVGKKPKDFDVATSATPNEIKATFRNCRIIGRRFSPRPRVFRIEDHRDRHVPRQPPRRGQQRSPDPPRQRVRHRNRGRAPPRLHDQRAVLRRRQGRGHRPRRRPARSRRQARPHDRRSGRALPGRSGPHAARDQVRGALGFRLRAADLARAPALARRDQQVRGTAAPRGDVSPDARRCGPAIVRAARRDRRAGSLVPVPRRPPRRHGRAGDAAAGGCGRAARDGRARRIRRRRSGRARSRRSR